MLKKLSISQEQVTQVQELLSKKLSGKAISEKLSIPQPTLWRNMELLGLNNKKNKNNVANEKYFNWRSFKNKSVI